MYPLSTGVLFLSLKMNDTLGYAYEFKVQKWQRDDALPSVWEAIIDLSVAFQYRFLQRFPSRTPQFYAC